MTAGSLRAFARYAKENGLTSDAVSYYHRQKTAGRLVMTEVAGKELVDFEASMIRMRETADPGKGYMDAVNEKQREQHQKTKESQQEASPEEKQKQAPTAEKGGATYMQAKTVREAAEAQIARVKLGVMQGKYVEKEKADRGAFTTARAIRDQIMGVPIRIAPLLASIADPFECEKLLREALRKCLADCIPETNKKAD